MFKWLSKFWSKPGLMKEAEDIVNEMLRVSYDMFQYSMRIVIDKEKEKEDIYKIDQELNEMQIEVRRKILEHLAINPAQDINPSLVLATVVVDVERIGDYSKNLIELSHKYPEPLSGKYIDRIIEIEEEVKSQFSKIKEIYKVNDVESGKELMQNMVGIIDRCHELLEEVVESDDDNCRERIVYTLLARYLKRVSAHLKNVASSVVNPFHRLGYKPENFEHK